MLLLSSFSWKRNITLMLTMLLFLAADTFHEELDEDVEMFKEGEGW